MFRSVSIFKFCNFAEMLKVKPPAINCYFFFFVSLKMTTVYILSMCYILSMGNEKYFQKILYTTYNHFQK